MRAARAQQLRHRGLIGDAIEMGRNRLRRRRHLTERKRGGEHLDEERFHAEPRKWRQQCSAGQRASASEEERPPWARVFQRRPIDDHCSRPHLSRQEVIQFKFSPLSEIKPRSG